MNYPGSTLPHVFNIKKQGIRKDDWMNKIAFNLFKDYNLRNIAATHYLDSLSRFNVFIGVNNSGKSRLLRHVFSTHYDSNWIKEQFTSVFETLNFNIENDKKLFAQVAVEFSKEVDGAAKGRYQKHDYLVANSMQDRQSFAKHRHILLELFEDRFERVYHNSSLKVLLEHNLMKNRSIIINKPYINPISKEISTSIYYPATRTFKNVLNISNHFLYTRQKSYKDYPIKSVKDTFLTSISMFDEFDYDNVVKHKLIDEYFLDKKSIRKLKFVNQKPVYDPINTLGYSFRDNDIFTGSEIYDYLKVYLLGSTEQRRVILDFQGFLGKHFFNDLVTLIPNEKNKTVTIQIGTGSNLKIHDIGDGIQQMILILFPLFLSRGFKQYVFIEEPELYMHPNLQRKLINILIEYFDKKVFFITTHSTYFLDLLSDSTIYNFKKVNEVFEVSKTNHDQLELFDELGVKPSGLFLSNCTIWLEGITDLIIVKKYMKLYLKAHPEKILLEDIHYSFAFYGGASYKNIEFFGLEEEHNKFSISGLSKKVLIISDSDYDDKGKPSKKTLELEEKYGDSFYAIRGCTIENTIEKDIMTEIMHEIVKSVDFKFTTSNYKPKANMRKVFDEVINPNINTPRSFGPESSKSLYSIYKRKIATAFQNMSDLEFSKLRLNAKNLTKRIVRFIEDSNNIKTEV